MTFQPARVALVTGSSSGIGRATAGRFAEAGYRVAVTYLTNAPAGEAVAAHVGGRAYRVDVADPDAVATLVEQVEAELGSIVVAVSNAGIYDEVGVESVSDDLWRRTLRVHLGGAFHLSRAVVPAMRRRAGGSIVLVSSELALVGSDRASPYVAAKSALIGLGRTLARELAPEIRVNVVAPGPVDTPLLPDRDRGQEYLATIPLGRIGRPDEIAAAILQLAEASWTTGAVYSPNGGVVIQ
ncbi:MAG: SDR family oxidoreductase [Chloroflexota bacterium]|nr:SDR family oxidoreductase [Chloroflexota bacterium]